MQFKWRTGRNAIISLATVHIVGFVGFMLAPDFFKVVTPVNIIYSAILVLLFHKKWNAKFIAFAIMAAVCGFLVEWAGVATGAIFGTYTYGSSLGWKLFEIPVLIGLNWLLLLYCCGTIAGYLKGAFWLKAVAGAVLMVLMDMLIEPFAIKFDLWAWQGDAIPLQNYAAWFVVSFLLLLPFHYYRLAERNKVAVALYGIQLVFFALLLLFA